MNEKRIRCPECRKMYDFASFKQKACPDCAAKEAEKYARVRALVKEKPGINLLKVSEETGVPHTELLRYIKDNKLETTGGTGHASRCDICGAFVGEGERCRACVRKHGAFDSQANFKKKRL